MNNPVTGRASRADVAFAAAACIVLAGYNNLAGVQPCHRRWYPVVNACAAAAVLAAAEASGLTAADLGLHPDQLRPGLRLGSAAAAPVVAAFGLAALTPATGPCSTTSGSPAWTGASSPTRCCCASRPGPRGGRGVVSAAGTFWEPGRAGVAAPGRQLRGPAGQRPGPAYRPTWTRPNALGTPAGTVRFRRSLIRREARIPLPAEPVARRSATCEGR